MASAQTGRKKAGGASAPKKSIWSDFSDFFIIHRNLSFFFNLLEPERFFEHLMIPDPSDKSNPPTKFIEALDKNGHPRYNYLDDLRYFLSFINDFLQYESGASIPSILSKYSGNKQRLGETADIILRIINMLYYSLPKGQALTTSLLKAAQSDDTDNSERKNLESLFRACGIRKIRRQDFREYGDIIYRMTEIFLEFVSTAHNEFIRITSDPKIINPPKQNPNSYLNLPYITKYDYPYDYIIKTHTTDIPGLSSIVYKFKTDIDILSNLQTPYTQLTNTELAKTFDHFIKYMKTVDIAFGFFSTPKIMLKMIHNKHNVSFDSINLNKLCDIDKNIYMNALYRYIIWRDTHVFTLSVMYTATEPISAVFDKTFYLNPMAFEIVQSVNDYAVLIGEPNIESSSIYQQAKVLNQTKRVTIEKTGPTLTRQQREQMALMLVAKAKQGSEYEKKHPCYDLFISLLKEQTADNVKDIINQYRDVYPKPYLDRCDSKFIIEVMSRIYLLRGSIVYKKILLELFKAFPKTSAKIKDELRNIQSKANPLKQIITSAELKGIDKDNPTYKKILKQEKIKCGKKIKGTPETIPTFRKLILEPYSVSMKKFARDYVGTPIGDIKSQLNKMREELTLYMKCSSKMFLLYPSDVYYYLFSNNSRDYLLYEIEDSVKDRGVISSDHLIALTIVNNFITIFTHFQNYFSRYINIYSACEMCFSHYRLKPPNLSTVLTALFKLFTKDAYKELYYEYFINAVFIFEKLDKNGEYIYASKEYLYGLYNYLENYIYEVKKSSSSQQDKGKKIQYAIDLYMIFRKYIKSRKPKSVLEECAQEYLKATHLIIMYQIHSKTSNFDNKKLLEIVMANVGADKETMKNLVSRYFKDSLFDSTKIDLKSRQDIFDNILTFVYG